MSTHLLQQQSNQARPPGHGLHQPTSPKPSLLLHLLLVQHHLAQLSCHVSVHGCSQLSYSVCPSVLLSQHCKAAILLNVVCQAVQHISKQMKHRQLKPTLPALTMCIGMQCVSCYANVSHFLTGDGAKAVAKRKLQQTKLPVSKQVGKQGAEAQAEVSGSNEPEAASPVVLPKVCFYLACRPLATQCGITCLHAVPAVVGQLQLALLLCHASAQLLVVLSPSITSSSVSLARSPNLCTVQKAVDLAWGY